MQTLRKAVVATLIVALLGVAPPQVTLRGYSLPASDRERADERLFLTIPSAAGALANAEHIGSRPHYAGSDGDHQLALYMRDQMRADGLDAELETLTARVDTPNRLALEILPPAEPAGRHGRRGRHRSGAQQLDLREQPDPSDPPTADREVMTPFNSGAADGDVRAPLVFANRGLPADYATLAAANVPVRGAIVLVRYGAEFRGLLAARAQAEGAAGVLFYSDPKDDGFARGAVYPRGPWRPLAAVQRGSVGTGITIPTLPISAANAQILLATLRGVPGPAGWGGALDTGYPLARGPAIVHLVVKLNRTTKTLWNTIARIPGASSAQEVMLGAHRDAWVAGVSDNGDGVTVMLEVARGLGYLVRNGWRPRRSIVIAGWDGEEIGLVGSTAYVTRHATELARTCVAYLNADENVTGSRFGADGAAAIAYDVGAATHEVPDPYHPSQTVYDRWRAQAHGTNVEIPGGGSDHEPFLFQAGIPIVNMGFSGPYGVYHSSYDTFKYARTFSDPDFAFHRTTAQLYGVVAMRLADANVVPYRFGGYVPLLRSGFGQIQTRVQRDGSGIDLAPMRLAIDRLAHAVALVDPLIAAGSTDIGDRELAAVHELDSLAYGANGYATDVFPAVTAAFTTQRPAAESAAIARAAGAIGRAADDLTTAGPAMTRGGETAAH